MAADRDCVSGKMWICTFLPISSCLCRFTIMHADLLLPQRQNLILERLGASGRVLAAELAEEFGVSEDTIRRDLRELASAGQCVRVYGGALPVPAVHGKTLSQRLELDSDRKAALAGTAAAFVRPGMTVFIDAGSTNLAIARALAGADDVTAVTNTPLIAAALMEAPGIRVIMTGGQIDPHVGGAIGLKALRDIETLRPDLCILGACGIDRNAGLTAERFDDAEFKRAAAEASGQVLAAVTNGKLATAAAHRVIGLSGCSAIVMEADAPAEAVAAYREAVPVVLRAGDPVP